MDLEKFKEVHEKLLEPFPPDDVEWRAGSYSESSKKAMALAYITARAVMNRLDDVLGPENWSDSYEVITGEHGDRGYVCTISVKIDGEWVSKSDGANETNFEAVKGGLSDSFKRAANKWGIGRYLYSLGATWVPAEKSGKFIKLKQTPKLPDWALPKDFDKESYQTPKISEDAPEEPKVTYTKAQIDKALKVKVPEGIPMAGKTLEEASKDTSTGVAVIKYLTGNFKNMSGLKFKPISDEEKEAQKAAVIVLSTLS